MEKNHQKEGSFLERQAMRKRLPDGVKWIRTLGRHTGAIGRIAWSPNGRILASPAADGTIRLWKVETGECLRVLDGHREEVVTAAFSPNGNLLASGGGAERSNDIDNLIRLWDVSTGALLMELEDHVDVVSALAFNPAGNVLASGSYDGSVKFWDLNSKRCLLTVGPEILSDSKWRDGIAAIFSIAFNPSKSLIAIGSASTAIAIRDSNNGSLVRSLEAGHGWSTIVSFDSTGNLLASSGDDKLIKIWDVSSGRQLLTLEGHTGSVTFVGFLTNSKLVISKGRGIDGSIRIWRSDTGECVAVIPEPANSTWMPGVAFHPTLPRFAVVGCEGGAEESSGKTEDEIWPSNVVHLLDIEQSILFGKRTKTTSYTSAKVVLVGDSGVGKTGLGWRLAHDEFKEHSSTHGQQFWLLKQLCKQRKDGTQCEGVLWDLAGQPDYRLIHALFLDDADLALLIFDPTRNDDPLSGVEFWLKQLKVGPLGKTPTLLIAARSDRGAPRLTREELNAFCKKRGIAGYLITSAKDGEGVEKLIAQMQGLIPWDEKPATVTTETFKRIKEFILNLKQSRSRRKTVLTPEELRLRLEKSDRKWGFSEAEMLTAVGHLANHGYVTYLKTSRGEPRILLAPELLNNLAASFVLEARRNQKGLGSLEEHRLLTDGYKFSELERLSANERAILLDSATALFLDHNVSFRETDPHNGRTYLVFPELINLKRPEGDDGKPVEDSVAYTVNGAVENVYASLVVLMGYTQTFTRTNQWRNHARYEVGNGQVCGFRLEEERAGELDFVLYFGTDTEAPVRMLFQSLFENFLARRNLNVRRFEPVTCANGHQLNRVVVREQTSSGAESAFCNRCGEKIILPKADQPIQLTRQQAKEVEVNRRAADQRSRFEQVLFRLKTFATEQNIVVPECFISYAWGNPDQERWVEKLLATDLQKAGILVLLDRWENARIGASVPRFVARVAKSNYVIVVGTPLYLKKFDNCEPMRGFVVAAEGDLIGKRMIGTEAQKESVMPLLLEGTEETAFPHLLHGRVYADFRKSENYAEMALELLFSLYGIPTKESLAAELRESLRGSPD